jgi:hypothetical protein
LGDVPLRLVALLAIVVLAAALSTGCGGSSVETDGTRTLTFTDEAGTPLPGKAPIGASAKTCDSYATDAESLRATGIPCDQARQVLYGWQREPSCSLPGGASRGSCLTGAPRKSSFPPADRSGAGSWRRRWSYARIRSSAVCRSERSRWSLTKT